jgi:hypothetical protein
MRCDRGPPRRSTCTCTHMLILMRLSMVSSYGLPLQITMPSTRPSSKDSEERRNGTSFQAF